MRSSPSETHCRTLACAERRNSPTRAIGASPTDDLGVNADEIEAEGEELRALADLDDGPVDGAVLAARLPWVLEVARTLAPHDGPRAWRVENDDGLDTIFLHKYLRTPGRSWLAASEGVEGHVVRREPPLICEVLKSLVWQITSAVLLPHYSVRRDVCREGIQNVPLLAARWHVSQAIFVRRYADIRAVPYAYVDAAVTVRAGLEYGDAKLAKLIHHKGDRLHQVIELSDRRAWIVWPREW